MNPSEIQIDSIAMLSETKDHRQYIGIIEEMAADERVKLRYVTINDNLKSIEVKFDQGLLFKYGNSDLNLSSQNALAKFSEILVKHPTVKIYIVGHSDNNGTQEFNQQISEKRAQTVADFLISKNVSLAQLYKVAGENYSEPVAHNSTAFGSAANRRVELFIVIPPIENISKVLTIDSIQSKKVPTSLVNLVKEVLDESDNAHNAEIEIDGLLVDDTKTKNGKDFYDLFYSGWEAPGGAKNFTITISEKPFRLTSTLIVIAINDNIVYQAILQPRQDIIESQSLEAIYQTQDYLLNYEEIMKQLNGEDLTGSGIY